MFFLSLWLFCILLSLLFLLFFFFFPRLFPLLVF
ncbi:MAG: transporter [Fervidicoccus sp.]|nr:MAG: transporter [Fervidicoccus sp.]